MKTIDIHGTDIVDAATFHDVFANVLGFPPFYGRNYDAWIDCMGYLDDPGAAMTTLHVEAGEQLLLSVNDASAFKARCPEVWFAFLECAATVNWRRTSLSMSPLLVVSAAA